MDLLEILHAAENATSPPADPADGIPAQKLPSWIRWSFRSLILPFIYLELIAEKIARWIIPPPFKQIGSCKRRGNCCHYILLPEVKGFFGKLLTFWHTEVYGFYLREKKGFEYEGKTITVMGCRYLNKNGSCSKHFFRPKVCRSWPVIQIFGYPRILKGCGYQAKVKKSYARKYPKLELLNETESED